MDIFWDLYQEHRIGRAQSAAERGQERAENAVERTRQLEARIDRLLLINMALWSLLKEKMGLAEEELMQKMKEIDAADGRVDGRIGGTVQQCPRCQRTMSQRHNRCLFCGYEPEVKDPFGNVRR